ncbi:MAG TPA: acyl-CoA synthetase [Actinomycetota bacterium]|nr:acyl-CoA synthetase [Actinomycetota bacterium]
MAETLFPPLANPPAREALRFGDISLTYEALRRAVSNTANRVQGQERVAVWASPSMEACVGVLGVLAAGAAAVPINPSVGTREIDHILDDCKPGLLIAEEDADLPDRLGQLERVPVELDVSSQTELPPEPAPEAPALIIYTSGTTGPPKGVVLPRRAIQSNLDALAEAWEWTSDDVLVHGLPLFHVHGLVLGVLGPVRLGGRLHHIGRFSPEAVCGSLAGEATMLFAVPTMYHRLADAVERDETLADALRQARVLVSGSAPLPARDFTRIERATGQKVVERYGLTETLMNCATQVSGDRRPGYVGPPLPGVEVRLVDDERQTIDASDDETFGEIAVRGPNLFTEYLNRPEDTAAAVEDGWFFTGDLATRTSDGYIRIMGRRSTDLIKTGGYKVGAGEIEAALLEHESVSQAAVVGKPDDDLGERIVAFVVLYEGTQSSPEELEDHVASLLAPHKRPRTVHFLDDLPHNEMGKVRKSEL